MLALSSSALLGWVLLSVPIEVTQRPPLPSCETGTRHVELTADAPPGPIEVCIRPELALNLLFDAQLARVDVEGRKRFRRVTVTDDALMLVASEALHDGERVPVTVSFKDGSAPSRATFVLVVHPSHAERQVEVSRHERTWASLRLGEQQARAEAQQCWKDKARLQAGCGGKGGLSALILDGWLGKEGITAQELQGLTSRAATPFEAWSVISYRAAGPEGRVRVAVDVKLFNGGTVAWTPSGAALMSAKGKGLAGLTVAPVTPIPPGIAGRVVVELDVAESEVRDSYTLKLWAEDAGAGSVSFDGVTFP